MSGICSLCATHSILSADRPHRASTATMYEVTHSRFSDNGTRGTGAAAERGKPALRAIVIIDPLHTQRNL